jgi:hypothetical protein
VAGAEISITSADIPETFLGKPVSSIGCGAFGGCSKLTSIAIPGSVRAIGSFAFFWCSSLSSVSFGGTVAQCEAAIDKGAICRFNDFLTVECSDGTHYIEIGFL